MTLFLLFANFLVVRAIIVRFVVEIFIDAILLLR